MENPNSERKQEKVKHVICLVNSRRKIMSKTEKLYSDASKIAFVNAVKLLEESKILHNNDRNARSYVLSILSMEEISKTLLYRCVSVGLMEEQKIRKFTLDHQNKIKHSQQILIMLSTFVDNYDEITKAIQHDKTTEHKEHIFPDIISKGVKKSISLVSDSFTKAHFTKLEAIYVDVRDGNVLDPNIRIDQAKTIEAIRIIEKILPLIKSIIDSKDDDFRKTMKDDILGFLVKIDFD